MSVKAENRYRVKCANDAAEALPTHTEMFLRDLNALPKADGAKAPFSDIHFVQGHGGWWAECPTTGYGYWYATLRKAVSAWRVAIFLDQGQLIGQPF